MSAPGFRHGFSSNESMLNSCAGCPLIVPTHSNSSMLNLPGADCFFSGTVPAPAPAAKTAAPRFRLYVVGPDLMSPITTLMSSSSSSSSLNISSSTAAAPLFPATSASPCSSPFGGKPDVSAVKRSPFFGSLSCEQSPNPSSTSLSPFPSKGGGF